MTLTAIIDGVEKEIPCEECNENGSDLELNDRYVCKSCAEAILAQLDDDDEE
jgi:formylmethanofuran dehydrogenase subunit E